VNRSEPEGQDYSRPLSSRLFLATASARILSAHVGQIGLTEDLPQTSHTGLGACDFLLATLLGLNIPLGSMEILPMIVEPILD
jgi:hypothetical protein